ncbi:cobalamin biosynthesis protein CobQ [Patescibacteria group bacterium]|nr:cobalamin biosynthesis protein CobQ [Patescibacteria group bacterium]
MNLNIAWLYPDLMSTYGDRGNIIAVTKRAEWRGIDVIVKDISLGTAVRELKSSDLIFMGGAQDRQQKIAGRDFLERKSPIMRDMVERGVPALFVCAAYQAVGRYYKPYQGDRIPGPGIFDLYTEHSGDQAKRLIGNVVAEILPSFWGASATPESDSGHARMTKRTTIVGFENHGGRTYLGPALKPLAKVIKGFGNNGEDGFEGAVYKHAVGSYFHGPLLPKNPLLADWLIQRALETKYGKRIPLPALDDTLEYRAQTAVLNRI